MGFFHPLVAAGARTLAATRAGGPWPRRLCTRRLRQRNYGMASTPPPESPFIPRQGLSIDLGRRHSLEGFGDIDGVT